MVVGTSSKSLSEADGSIVDTSLTKNCILVAHLFEMLLMKMYVCRLIVAAFELRNFFQNPAWLRVAVMKELILSAASPA